MNRLCESPSIPLSTKSNKILSGLFAECEKRNQNERIYPKKVYMPALEELMPKIREGRLLGECDHPTDRDEICLANVSHVVRECRVEGNNVYGTVELLDTPAGKIAQALHEAGIPLGISSRGIGNTRRVNEGDEVTDFKLITFDLVADPSFSNAILTESAKIKLQSRLDSIVGTLPLNESIGGNDLRIRIDEIKTRINKAPTVTDKLIESLGSVTVNNEDLSRKLSESKIRNKSLKSNMENLQESYNLLYESTKVLEYKYKEDIKSYNARISSLKESYDLKFRGLTEEVVNLRKQLAIEKRGLSVDAMMPILEGLTSSEDIENKLNSVKHLNARRYVMPTPSKSQTEGTSRRGTNKLSSIISSV